MVPRRLWKRRRRGRQEGCDSGGTKTACWAARPQLHCHYTVTVCSTLLCLNNALLILLHLSPAACSSAAQSRIIDRTPLHMSIIGWSLGHCKHLPITSGMPMSSYFLWYPRGCTP